MILVAINPNVKQRETKWICVCPNCQCERIISYAQKWNIETKKSSDLCRPCLKEFGLLNMNLTGLKLGRKYHEDKNPISSNKTTYYKNIFNNPSNNPETRKKQRLAKLGKTGELASRWQGGKTSERNLLMNQDKYKQLRKRIFERDDYTCQTCKKVGGNLNMDHIKEWCNYPELRYEETNCRTLCLECHKKTDNYLHKAKKSKNAI